MLDSQEAFVLKTKVDELEMVYNISTKAEDITFI